MSLHQLTTSTSPLLIPSITPFTESIPVSETNDTTLSQTPPSHVTTITSRDQIGFSQVVSCHEGSVFSQIISTQSDGVGQNHHCHRSPRICEPFDGFIGSETFTRNSNSGQGGLACGQSNNYAPTSIKGDGRLNGFQNELNSVLPYTHLDSSNKALTEAVTRGDLEILFPNAINHPAIGQIMLHDFLEGPKMNEAAADVNNFYETAGNRDDYRYYSGPYNILGSHEMGSITVLPNPPSENSQDPTPPPEFLDKTDLCDPETTKDTDALKSGEEMGEAEESLNETNGSVAVGTINGNGNSNTVLDNDLHNLNESRLSSGSEQDRDGNGTENKFGNQVLGVEGTYNSSNAYRAENIKWDTTSPQHINTFPNPYGPLHGIHGTENNIVRPMPFLPFTRPQMFLHPVGSYPSLFNPDYFTLPQSAKRLVTPRPTMKRPRNTEASAERRINKSSQKNHVCHQCKNVFERSKQLFCHIENIHNGNMHHLCDNCAMFSVDKFHLLKQKRSN